MIHAHFFGNLGRDATLRRTADGTAVLGFSVATKSGFGDKAQTLWVDCSLWGKRGESLSPYLKKGTQVVIHGELTLREYQANDGTQRSTLACRIAELDLVGRNGETQDMNDSDGSSYAAPPARYPDPMPPQAPAQVQNRAPVYGPGGDDDIPF